MSRLGFALQPIIDLAGMLLGALICVFAPVALAAVIVAISPVILAYVIIDRWKRYGKGGAR